MKALHYFAKLTYTLNHDVNVTSRFIIFNITNIISILRNLDLLSFFIFYTIKHFCVLSCYIYLVIQCIRRLRTFKMTTVPIPSENSEPIATQFVSLHNLALGKNTGGSEPRPEKGTDN